MASVSFDLILTPHGHLRLIERDDASVLDADLAQRCRDAFARGSGHGLLQLGAGEVGTALPPTLSYWRDFGARYVTALCSQTEAAASRQGIRMAPPPEGDLDRLA